VRKRFVFLDVQHQRVAVDEDDLPVAVVEFDLLVAVGLDVDPEILRDGCFDVVYGVRPEVVSRLDVHTSFVQWPGDKSSALAVFARAARSVPPVRQGGSVVTERSAAASRLRRSLVRSPLPSRATALRKAINR